MKQVLFGIDTFLLEQKAFHHLRFALVTNNVATNSSGELSRMALLKAGFTITKLFSPEHGLTAQGEDGSFQDHSIDSITQLPVISLYGDHLTPTEKDVADIDAVLFDIPDAGCRFYTYLWTMTYMMEACSKYKKIFVVLDRPNPIGGEIEKAEGPLLNEINCSSFIGRWNIPIRHSCTLGELATYFAATKIKYLDLKIITLQNWNRNQTAEAGWNFIPTSPAIRDIETALLYPGMGLLEGINVNEGRGTIKDFKIFGAPWIDAVEMNHSFKQLNIAGIETTEISYIPDWGLYAKEKCNGLQFSITNIDLFRPVAMGLQILQLILSLYPEQCKERLYPTVANPAGAGHLDKLIGIYKSFGKLKKNELQLFNSSVASWQKTIDPYLLY